MCVICNNPPKKGVVTFYSNTRGYGFIRNSDNESLFFHYSQVDNPSDKPIRVWDKVQYSLTKISQRGQEARDIHFL